ncbi:hypothetical protein OIU77_005025 [Salix suchowensis]|uniref:CBS domain-containing protein n=1 Tax=Salix suchowensis TaxID=1278906 RepID=A0ABQ9AWK5_9ROSI|nr:hypothetical protein OIU77_005025 [Salix suchowensis]
MEMLSKKSKASRAPELLTSSKQKVKGADGSWLWCTTDDTVYDAVKAMTQHNVGALVVVKTWRAEINCRNHHRESCNTFLSWLYIWKPTLERNPLQAAGQIAHLSVPPLQRQLALLFDFKKSFIIGFLMLLRMALCLSGTTEWNQGTTWLLFFPDYLRKIIVQGRSSKSTKVGDIMTEENKLITVTPDTKVLKAMQLMTDKRIRHIPVIDDKDMIGMVSIGDVVRAVVSEHREELDRLNAYIQGGY